VIEYPDNKILEAKNDVVVINENGEKLNTEQLFWDQKEQKITSNTFVKITRKTEIIMGDGLESNHDGSLGSVIVRMHDPASNYLADRK
jgi:LPS export ABC transporter protein LptC